MFNGKSRVPIHPPFENWWYSRHTKDKDLTVALNIVKAGYLSHKALSKQMSDEIDTAKQELKDEIRNLKGDY